MRSSSRSSCLADGRLNVTEQPHFERSEGGWDVIADGERKKMFDTPQQYARDDVAALEAQIEELKQAIVLLQAQLGEMRKQRDRWQSRAERISLVSVG
jgi:hypothetical protein